MQIQNKCIITWSQTFGPWWIFYNIYIFPKFTFVWDIWHLRCWIAANDSLYPHPFLCLFELLSLHSAERLWEVVTSVAFCSLSELGYRQCLISHAVDDLLYSCPSELCRAIGLSVSVLKLPFIEQPAPGSRWETNRDKWACIFSSEKKINQQVWHTKLL